MNVLITGANRGIGLGFVKHYLSLGHDVWASYRKTPDALSNIDSSQLHLIQLDINDVDPEQLQQATPDKLDILINNAGIFGPGKDSQSLGNLTADAMITNFATNCVGPLLVTQALKDKVIAAKGLIANVSSKMGSSTDNMSGGTYAYRAAKAALINVSTSLAVDLEADKVHVITLHPGWVKTDMTNHSGLIDIETSVSGMTQVIERAKDYELGSFIAFDGQEIPF